jgi:hypothetical protein
MPGIILHLTFGKMVSQYIEKKNIDIDLNLSDFYAGCLIPDLAIDKKASHYRIRLPHSRLQVPELHLVMKDLLVKDDALKLGMYCHLYLDHYFIKDFLITEFIWDFEKMEVTNPRTGKVYEYDEFISKNGFYSAYTEINHKLITDGYVDINLINSIPTILPQTSLPIFDSRREKTWREELDYYLVQNAPYTGTFLDYHKLMKFIEKTAKQFIKDIHC